MSKTQENKIWLVTFLDLLMIMTCFFVLIYSLNLRSNKSGEGKNKNPELSFITDKSTSSGPLEIIYISLKNYYQDDSKKVHILKSKEKIRLIHQAQHANKENLSLQAREIGRSIFNFNKNLIKVRLLVNFDKLQEESSSGAENLPEIM
ncbi:MAG: flagellar motor protein MotB, partial [Rickettsiaceae bacterium]|nr:flagellar motor protein MotB [Rickettsiaceae bacterium]